MDTNRWREVCVADIVSVSAKSTWAEVPDPFLTQRVGRAILRRATRDGANLTRAGNVRDLRSNLGIYQDWGGS